MQCEVSCLGSDTKSTGNKRERSTTDTERLMMCSTSVKRPKEVTQVQILADLNAQGSLTGRFFAFFSLHTP